MSKTVSEINEKIAARRAKVVRADEMTRIVREIGSARAAREIDVVTTGTFGAMCSSGAWLNFGHSDPPIRMARVWLNDVEAYAGVAAVDAYIGATQPSTTLGLSYGGAHVIEDLLRGRRVVLRAVSRGTDCYPRKRILTEVGLEDLNFALLSNPRNGYQRYNAAANTSPRTLQTYMGTLRPHAANVTFSGAGELSPLNNDPEYRSIGAGTRIFLGGGPGMITGNGSQHNPGAGFGTLMVQGDLRGMSPDFLCATVFQGYGCTLFVGLGVPIPILDEEAALRAGVSDEEILVDIVDYGVRRRSRPSLGKVSYAALKSGRVEIGGRSVPAVSLSNARKACEIADVLKRWIEGGDFLLSEPVETLPRRAVVKPLEIRRPQREAGARPSARTEPSPDAHRPEKTRAEGKIDRNADHGKAAAVAPADSRRAASRKALGSSTRQLGIASKKAASEAAPSTSNSSPGAANKSASPLRNTPKGPALKKAREGARGRRS